MDDALQLPGIDVLPAPNDHFLLPVHDEEVAVPVPEGHVPRVEPPAAQGLRRLFRPIPVSLHHMAAADADFPHLARGHFLVPLVQEPDLAIREGNPDGTDLPHAVDGVGRGAGGAFREPVPLDDDHVEGLLEPADRLHGHRGGPAHAVPEGRQVQPLVVRRGKKDLVDRRHAAEDADAVFRDALPEFRGGEVPAQDDLGAHRQRRRPGDDQPVDMKQGKEAQNNVLLVNIGKQARLPGVGQDIPVREQNPLGIARRPRSVDDGGNVIGIDPHGGRRSRLRHHFFKGEEPVVRGLPLDDMLQGGRPVEDPVDVRPVAVIEEKGHRARVVQQVLNLAGLPPAVHRPGNAADLDDSEIGVVELRSVVHEEAHPVSLPHAQPVKGAGHPAALFVQLPVGDVPLVVADGDFVFVAPGLGFHHVPNVFEFAFHSFLPAVRIGFRSRHQMRRASIPPRMKSTSSRLTSCKSPERSCQMMN